jgi:hypothetical protein
MKLISLLICLVAFLSLGDLASNAQPTNPPPATNQQTATEARTGISNPATTAQITFKTPYELYLTGLTVILGIAFAILFCLIHWIGVADEGFSRSYIVLVVVFAALFLIVAGYSQEQVAPVFGLLGSIIGYIFGRLSSEIQQRLTAASEKQTTTPSVPSGQNP